MIQDKGLVVVGSGVRVGNIEEGTVCRARHGVFVGSGGRGKEPRPEIELGSADRLVTGSLASHLKSGVMGTLAGESRRWSGCGRT